MKAEVFQGTANQVQEALTAFLKDKNIKLHSFTQSQSTVSNTTDGEHIIITATVLYTDYGTERKQVTGFQRD